MCKAKKLICDWTDKKHYLVQYWMLKLFVRHGMIMDKNHEIIPFKQSKWLGKISVLLRESEIGLTMILKKISINDLITDFREKQWKVYEIV